MRRAILKLSAGWVLCAAAWGASGGQTITNKTGECKISFPDGWIPINTANEIAAGSSEGTAWFNVIANDVKEGAGLRSAFEKEDIKNSMRPCVLTGIQICRVAGRVAFKMDLDDDRPSSKVHYAFYYVVAGTRGYGIWCGADKSDFDKYRREFEAIVASFKLIDSK